MLSWFVDCGTSSNVRFTEKNLFNAIEEIKIADVLLMRMVAQHIGSAGLDEFFELFSKYGKASAKILILDVDDKGWSLTPDIPGFSLLLDSCHYNQSKFGGDRYIGRKCKDLATKRGLKVEGLQILPFDSFNIGMNSFSSILEVLFKFKADSDFLEKRDIETIQKNFVNWRNNSDSFGYGCLFLTQVGKHGE